MLQFISCPTKLELKRKNQWWKMIDKTLEIILNGYGSKYLSCSKADLLLLKPWGWLPSDFMKPNLSRFFGDGTFSQSSAHLLSILLSQDPEPHRSASRHIKGKSSSAVRKNEDHTSHISDSKSLRIQYAYKQSCK